MRDALLVASGGAIGSVLRWWLSGLVQRAAGAGFPWGTLAVNLVGSFAIGLIGGMAAGRGLGAPAAKLFLIAGLLGGFTTFSAFSWENQALLRDGRWLAGAAYMAGSVALGLLSAFAGAAMAVRS